MTNDKLKMDKLKRDKRWRKEGGDLAYFKVNKIHKKKNGDEA